MSKMLPKVAILIADSNLEPFATLRRDIHPVIWAKLESSGVDIFHVIGREPNILHIGLSKMSDRFRYKRYWIFQKLIDKATLNFWNYRKPRVVCENNRICVSVPEGLRYLGIKIRSALFYLDDSGYDFVYKTTASSLVNSSKFIELIENLNKEEIPTYAGQIINTPRHQFISGANLLVNRRTIQILRQSVRRWDNSRLDDVAIGRLLEGKVKLIDIPMKNFSKSEQVIMESDEVFSEYLHFRCKSDEFPRSDAAIISKVFDRLSRIE